MRRRVVLRGRRDVSRRSNRGVRVRRLRRVVAARVRGRERARVVGFARARRRDLAHAGEPLLRERRARAQEQQRVVHGGLQGGRVLPAVPRPGLPRVQGLFPGLA